MMPMYIFMYETISTRIFFAKRHVPFLGQRQVPTAVGKEHFSECAKIRNGLHHDTIDGVLHQARIAPEVLPLVTIKALKVHNKIYLKRHFEIY